MTLVIGPTPLDPLSPSRDICVKFLNLPYMANFYDLLQGVPKKRVISEKWSLWATGFQFDPLEAEKLRLKVAYPK